MKATPFYSQPSTPKLYLQHAVAQPRGGARKLGLHALCVRHDEGGSKLRTLLLDDPHHLQARDRVAVAGEGGRILRRGVCALWREVGKGKWCPGLGIWTLLIAVITIIIIIIIIVMTTSSMSNKVPPPDLDPDLEIPRSGSLDSGTGRMAMVNAIPRTEVYKQLSTLADESGSNQW